MNPATALTILEPLRVDEALLTCAHQALSDACTDRRVGDMRATGQWRDQLLTASAELTTEARLIFATNVAIEHPHLDFDELCTGIGQRRVDAIFDTLDIPTCAMDLQMLYAEAVDALLSPEDSLGWFGTRMSLAFAGGWFGFGTHGVTALDWVREHLHKSDEAVVGDLARLFVVYIALLEFGEENSRTTSLLRKKVNEITLAHQTRLGRMLVNNPSGAETKAARKQVELLQRMCVMLAEDGDDSQSAMPNLVGQRLADAEHALTLRGQAFRAEDALKPDGVTRGIYNKKNWVVAVQEPAAGSALARTVTLLVTKQGERYLP